MDLRVLWQAAYVAALLKIEEGHPDEAAKHIADGLAMAASLWQEPNIIPQLLRIAMRFSKSILIQRLMTRAETSKASLDEIARRLEENRSPDPILVGALSDARMTHAILRRMHEGPPRRRSDGSQSLRVEWPGRTDLPPIRADGSRVISAACGSSCWTCGQDPDRCRRSQNSDDRHLSGTSPTLHPGPRARDPDG